MHTEENNQQKYILILMLFIHKASPCGHFFLLGSPVYLGPTLLSTKITQFVSDSSREEKLVRGQRTMEVYKCDCRTQYFPCFTFSDQGYYSRSCFIPQQMRGLENKQNKIQQSIRKNRLLNLSASRNSRHYPAMCPTESRK